MIWGHPLVRKKRQGKKEPIPKDRRSLGELAIARWRGFLNRIIRLSIVVRFLGSRPRKPFSHPSGSSARVLASPWDAHSPVRGRFPLLQAPTPAFCRSHKALCSFPGPFRLLEKWFTGTGPVPSLPLAQGKVGSSTRVIVGVNQGLGLQDPIRSVPRGHPLFWLPAALPEIDSDCGPNTRTGSYSVWSCHTCHTALHSLQANALVATEGLAWADFLW